jgi:lipoyl(octanoyl) transferase
MSDALHIVDAGVMAYGAAWDMQLALHEQVLTGKYPRGALMLVEHPPVITIGRHPGAEKHLIAPAGLLKLRGVEVVETDRGGDITFHGPGQLVGYPIIPLNTYNLNIRTYMRLLEQVVIGVLAGWGLVGERSEGATGVWVRETRNGGVKAVGESAKICAMGIKVRRWVTFHGIALNVTTDLSYFELINPCGLGRPVTSLQKLGVEKKMPAVKQAFVEQLQRLLGELKPR